MKKFPQKTITRSLLYIRILEKLINEGKEYISSKELSEIAGLTDVQVRKDISNFGRVGKPRVGYRTDELKRVLEEFVTTNIVHVVLFGVGNLGLAILRYPKFHQDKIRIVAAFDRSKNKIGKEINGVKIYSIDDAVRVIKSSHAEIAVIAVGEDAAQDVADIIVASGLSGIINFSPVSINVPDGVSVKHIDLTIEFLSFFCSINGNGSTRE